jgi:hypothetical protein
MKAAYIAWSNLTSDFADKRAITIFHDQSEGLLLDNIRQINAGLGGKSVIRRRRTSDIKTEGAHLKYRLN